MNIDEIIKAVDEENLEYLKRFSGKGDSEKKRKSEKPVRNEPKSK